MALILQVLSRVCCLKQPRRAKQSARLIFRTTLLVFNTRTHKTCVQHVLGVRAGLKASAKVWPQKATLKYSPNRNMTVS